MRRGTKVLAGAFLAIVALLAACGEQIAPAEPAAGRVPTSSPSGGGQAESPGLARKLIQNAELRLEVESCDEARRAIEAMVAEAGGYVSSTNVDHHEGRASRAVLVLRLPAASLGSALQACSELGTVVYETLDTQDITEEYFDLEARLVSAQQLETRLHELLATRTEGVEDLLEVERELARVRETIERFEGKLRLWESQVAYSTLTVELTTSDVFVAGTPLTLGEQLGHTISSSWQGLLGVGRALLLLVAAFLPWVIPLPALVWLGVRLVRRFDRRAAAARAKA